MKLNLSFHYPKLGKEEKELIQLFFQKRFAKLFRLTAKKDEPLNLTLSCDKDKAGRYLLEARLEWQGKTFYAQVTTKEITNGLTEVAKRLRKEVKKIKANH